jgi:hypothetical protein
MLKAITKRTNLFGRVCDHLAANVKCGGTFTEEATDLSAQVRLEQKNFFNFDDKGATMSLFVSGNMP